MRFLYKTNCCGGQTLLIDACSKDEADRKLADKISGDRKLAAPAFWWTLNKVYDNSGKEVKIQVI